MCTWILYALAWPLSKTDIVVRITLIEIVVLDPRLVVRVALFAMIAYFSIDNQRLFFISRLVMV